VGLARAGRRGAPADVVERESLAFHNRVRSAYLDLAAADPPRYLVLNAQDDEHKLAEEIAERVAGLVPPSGPSEHLPDVDQAERVRTHAVAASS
jgi:dTMP kinase